MKNQPGRIDFQRRDFLRIACVGGGSLLLPFSGTAAEDAVDVWVLHGSDRVGLMNECLKIIDANGGFGRNVKKLALKVNAAWSRTPELGATTHPELVSTFIRGAQEAGALRVDVPENPCNRAEQAFTRSGILDAVEAAGGHMTDLKTQEEHFVEESIPEGRTLQQAKVARQFLEADAVVNMPIAKDHRGATVTMCMKNWMGAVQDRRFWHRNGLHECIADFSSYIRPAWSIIDATRVMLHRGPQGGQVDFLKKPDPNLLIVSRDQVAADAYATRLFDLEPMDVRYLKMARERRLGETELERMKVHTIEVPA